MALCFSTDAVQNDGLLTPALMANDTFTLVCTNGTASVSKSVSIAVAATPTGSSNSPAPTALLSSNLNQVTSGQTVVLNWSSTNALTCNLTQQSTGFSLSQSLQGQVTSPILVSNEAFNPKLFECPSSAARLRQPAVIVVPPPRRGFRRPRRSHHRLQSHRRRRRHPRPATTASYSSCAILFEARKR